MFRLELCRSTISLIMQTYAIVCFSLGFCRHIHDTMKRLYFIEPIVAIYAFASFMVYPLVQQYVYRRLWLEITNSSYPVSDNTSQCAANSTNHSRQQDVSNAYVT